MPDVRIDQLPSIEGLLANGDTIPLWDASKAKTVKVPFSELMKSIYSYIAANGIVGKVENNYFVFKFNDSGVLVQTEDLGTSYPPIE